MATINQARVRELLNYNPETGQLTWKVSTGSRAAVGRVAGWPVLNGYLYVQIDNKKYLCHRVIWLYMTGEWPKEQIDHRDGARSNNRWNNLREATHSQNEMNKGMRGGLRTNKAGIKGVSFDKARMLWSAEIRVGGARHRLGRFATKEAAGAAYRNAAIILHGEYARVD